jgi:hypothetical protein
VRVGATNDPIESECVEKSSDVVLGVVRLRDEQAHDLCYAWPSVALVLPKGSDPECLADVLLVQPNHTSVGRPEPVEPLDDERLHVRERLQRGPDDP